MPTSLKYPTTTNAVQKTLDSALLTGVTAAVTLNSVTGIQNKAGVFVVDRVDANNVATPSKREYITFTGVSGSTLTNLTRNADGGGSDQDHGVGAIVEFVSDVLQEQAIIDGLLTVITTAGALDTTKVVDLTTAQTLTNKTLTSPTLTTPALGTPASGVMTNVTGTAASLTAGTATVANGLKSATTTVSVSAATAPSANQVLTATDSTTATWVTPTAASADGWTAAGTFTYASASTITVASGAAAIYAVGDRLKWTQTTVKYGVIVAVADTLLTIAVNTDYTVANAAITSPYYSHQESPVGYPAVFAYTPTWTADSGVAPAIGDGSISGRFSIVGRDCNVNIRVIMGASSTYGSGGTAYRLSLPVAYSSSSFPLHSGIYQDSGTATNDCYGYGEPAATTYINLRRTGGNYAYTTTPFTWAASDGMLFSGTYKI